MVERRSFASRLYRFFDHRTVRYLTALWVLLSWSYVLLAANIPTASPEVNRLIELGAFGALCALISRWVITPAINEHKALDHAEINKKLARIMEHLHIEEEEN